MTKSCLRERVKNEAEMNSCAVNIMHVINKN
jgi:hypothetical protein